MSAVEVSLVGAAFLFGMTGTWSPCGFSMVETIGPRGHSGGRASTLAACATFAAGAVVGGVFTFVALSAAGALVHGAGGRVAYLIAAALAAAAAVAEARGVPIVPQVRRQLPEGWRWRMPMPLVAALYGILLGLGFTTFVLTLGVWALAGISFALGDPQIGLLAGIAFGVGRALPVALIAPLVERPIGVRMIATMAERPGILRGARFADGLALLAVALTLTVTDAATATTNVVSSRASDPSAVEPDLVWQRPDRRSILYRGGIKTLLPGSQPAMGGPFIAVIAGAKIRLLDRTTLTRVRAFRAPGADAVAVSGSWLVWRRKLSNGDDRLIARPSHGPGSPHKLVQVKPPDQLSAPSLDHSALAYEIASRNSTRIFRQALLGGNRRALLASKRDMLSSPSIKAKSLLYVRTTNTRQQLTLKRTDQNGPGRVLYEIPATSWRGPDHDPGYHMAFEHHIDLRRSAKVLWTTSLTSSNAYVTSIAFHSGKPRGTILRVSR